MTVEHVYCSTSKGYHWWHHRCLKLDLCIYAATFVSSCWHVHTLLSECILGALEGCKYESKEQLYGVYICRWNTALCSETTLITLVTLTINAIIENNSKPHTQTFVVGREARPAVEITKVATWPRCKIAYETIVTKWSSWHIMMIRQNGHSFTGESWYKKEH